jgi:predicted nucleic acid-binding protein
VILDTNVISAMAEGDTALEKVLPDVRSQFIPVICLGEYRAGIIRSRSRQELDRWLNLLASSRRILPIELDTNRFLCRDRG